MQRSVVSAFDPDAGDRAPLALGRIAADVLTAQLLAVAVRPGGSVADRFARLEHAGAPLGAPGETGVREVSAPSPAAGLHAVLDGERPLLAVLGSPRTGALGRVRLGTTSARLVDGAPCALAIAPSGHVARELERVAVALLPSAEGRAAMRVAAELATGAGAALHVVMVLADTPDEEQARALAREIAPGLADDAGVHDAIDILLPAIAAAAAPCAPPSASILVGDPGEALVGVSRRADALVLGSRAYGPCGSVHTGGVARRVLDGAWCPVVVVPREHDRG